ncbi:MAG: alpha/beta hydrolase [Rhodothermales bacterium]
MGLVPMAVLLAHQRRGIGAAPIRGGFERTYHDLRGGGFLLLALLLTSCRTVDVNEATFFRPRPCPSTDVVESPFDDVRVQVDEYVRIQVLLWSPREPDALLIYLGGNETRHCSDEAANKSRMRLHAWAEELNIAVALVNYRGYAQSEGSANLELGRIDALKVYQVLTADPRFSRAPVIAHGQSLGSSFAIELSLRGNVAGLVLESPPTTARAVLSRATPWYVKPFVRYRIAEHLGRENNASAAANISSPLLIIVGDSDPVTPLEMSEAVLAEAKSEEKSLVVIPGGHHGDLARFDAFWMELGAFVGKVSSTPPIH